MEDYMLATRDIIIETLDVPSFELLKSAVGGKYVASYMYMASYKLQSGMIVHTFKHIITRSYVNLSDDGRCWKYVSGGYTIVEREAAIRATIGME